VGRWESGVVAGCESLVGFVELVLEGRCGGGGVVCLCVLEFVLRDFWVGWGGG